MVKLSTYIIIISLLLSCTQELDLALPTTPPQLVLNGLLHSDSTIRIALTTTLPPSTTSTNFPVVDNAMIRVYEDGEVIDNLTFQDSFYVLDYYPKIGSEYTVEAEVPGYATIRATDIVPNLPEVKVCFRKDTASYYQFSDAILDIAIFDSEQENNSYWLDIVSTFPDFPRCRIKEDSVAWEDGESRLIMLDTIVCKDNSLPTFEKSRWYDYKSFSSIPDRFNAFVDNTSGGVTVYEGYMRVDDTALNGEPILYDIALERYEHLTRYPRIHPRLSTVVTITNASQHYDRYLKSSITYLLNRQYSTDEDLGFKPFVQSNQVYSNVENGTGIFAAYSTASIQVEQHPCE